MKTAGHNSRSGNLLVLTMVAMFLVAMALMGVLMVTANSLHLNHAQNSGASAFNIAESGAEVAALWLKDQPYPPMDSAPFDPFDGTRDLDGGTYQVTIHPGSDNFTSYLKTYRIVSVGTFGGSVKTVEIVVRQASFGRFAYFTDKETSSVSGGAIWWKAGEKIDGPAHSNNTDGTNFNVNYNGSTQPIFLDMLTASGSSINYNPSRPRNEAAFQKIFLNGSKGFKLGVPPILLPNSSDTQRNSAWGGTTGLPGTNGVYLRADLNGGIYIRGDAALTLSLDAWGNQVIRVTQGSNVTDITLDKVTQGMIATGPLGTGSAATTATLGTGVIYCTGNITSLKGEIADNRVVGDQVLMRSEFTIANDVNAGKSITITDNLFYHTRPDKTLDADDPANLAAGTMGLVSKDIKISSSAPRNLEIDAVCMAGGQNTTGGSFYVENYSSKKPTGTLKVLGGIIQKARGPVGTFDAGSGTTLTGYAKDYSYDPRLAQNPPPFYPTTGQYERLSWQLLANQ